MEALQVKKKLDSNVKAKMQDILLAISWRELAHSYFDKSASWLYHKLDGIDGNGGVGGFSDEEKDKLKGALCDLSYRIRVCADKL